MKGSYHHWLLALLFSGWSAVAAQDGLQPKPFTIKGTFKNGVPGTKVYLQLGATQQPVVLDSTTLAKDGTFSFTRTEADGGNVYQINLANRQRLNFLAEGGEQFTLAGDANDSNEDGVQTSGTITGSTNMTYYHKILQQVGGLREKVALWNTEYEKASQKNDQKKINEIQGNFEKAERELMAQIKTMLPEMGSSFIAVFTANNFLNSQQDLPVLEALADKLQKENPNPKYAQAFIAGVKRIKGISVGDLAPEFSLSDPDGKAVTLSSLRGKYVLLDFWASWCGPCRRENPNVVKLYDRYKSKNFEIYGVSLDKDKEKWIQAIKDDNLTWVHGSDLKYWNSNVAAMYGVNGIPATYLLDQEGRVIAKDLRGAALEKKLEELLK
ncbi:TlpA disulfide reductase family protein [Ravibacter arvi]|uniref:TlpA disulfide reductase family protein n=1 Tax=Ravibacter arvi TaxID=2051041 RepID=A0ABP8LXW8_9BACT